jgi:hypothetical protein
VSADSQAQRALFGGSVYDDDFTWPMVELGVRSCALRAADEIRERARARAASNLAAYQAATAPPPSSSGGRGAKKRAKKEQEKKKEVLGVKSGGGVKKPTRTKKARGKGRRY